MGVCVCVCVCYSSRDAHHRAADLCVFVCFSSSGVKLWVCGIILLVWMCVSGCASVSGIFTLCQIRVSVHMHACVQGCVFGSSFEEVSKQEGVCVCVFLCISMYD